MLVSEYVTVNHIQSMMQDMMIPMDWVNIVDLKLSLIQVLSWSAQDLNIGLFPSET